MSYDLSLTSKPCPTCGCVAVSWSSDPTWNLGDMFREAGFEPGSDSPLHGKPAKEVLPIAEAALAAMKAEPERFKRHNPENGWGSYDSLLTWYEDFIQVLRCDPEAVFRTRYGE